MFSDISSAADRMQIYQFRITLNGTKPPIWRRIQIEDCVLEKLHLYIQAAMGWENTHLYRIRIGTRRFSLPGTMDEDQYDFDSTATLISEVLPRDGSRFRFVYEYDFGDGWLHGVLFEGCPKAENGQNYPFCVEGERACPPENIGGLWGYKELLEAIAWPRRKKSKELMEWVGPFDPENFDTDEVTRKMREIDQIKN